MKKLLLCLLLCACQIPNDKPVTEQVQPQQESNSMQYLSECTKTDKGSILWYDHFSNDVILQIEDKYDSARKICSKTKIYNRQEVTHPVFLYYTYKQDMSEKCRQAVSEFINELNERVCL